MVVLYGASPDPFENPRVPYLPAPVYQVPMQGASVTLDAAQFGQLMDELRTLRHALNKLAADVSNLKTPKRRKTKTGSRK